MLAVRLEMFSRTTIFIFKQGFDFDFCCCCCCLFSKWIPSGKKHFAGKKNKKKRKGEVWTPQQFFTKTLLYVEKRLQLIKIRRQALSAQAKCLSFLLCENFLWLKPRVIIDVQWKRPTPDIGRTREPWEDCWSCCDVEISLKTLLCWSAKNVSEKKSLKLNF